MNASRSPEAGRETSLAARNSVIAAVLLTTLKLAVGLSTNSLGMLSEAAHSGLDLVAAAVTWWAVRFAASPPDERHPYGHGKAENLAALIESLLLLVTCIWVVYEAIDRLFFAHVVVDASMWAFGVMAVSIIVDYNRSRMLMRLARKHNSQALEADALHFSTDIWSSAVVILGLACVWAASFLDSGSILRPWLERADALAAVGVCVIIVRVSMRLGKQAVDILLDAGDDDVSAKLSDTLSALPGLISVDRLRVRRGGPTVFVEAACQVDGSLALEETTHLRNALLTCIQNAIDGHADVSLQLVPHQAESRDPFSVVRSVAAAHGLAAHSVEMAEVESAAGEECARLIELHVEMDPDMLLGDAHEVVSDFEQELLGQYFCAAVVTHMEPRLAPAAAARAVAAEEQRISEAIVSLAQTHPEICDCHNVLVRAASDRFFATFHCRMRPDASVREAHDTATRLQSHLYRQLPELERVTIHLEPLKVHEAEPDT